jgi:transposase
MPQMAGAGVFPGYLTGREQMPTPQREALRRLSRAERAALQRMAKSTSERVDEVRRATALLAVARTGVFIHAAREAGLHSGTTVADLVARFNRHGLAAVRIAQGRGRRPMYAASARAQIVATAQRQPDRRADGTATWSLSTLQRTLRRGSFPRLGTSTIRRVLQDAGSSYQRTRTWCPTGTAQRKRKAGVVTVVDPQTEVKRGSSNSPTTSRSA